MSKRYRPHRHERRQQYAVKMRVEYLKSETDFAPNKPRTKSVVTVESTERARFGRAHVANALRRGEYHNRKVETNPIGKRETFTPMPSTFTLTDSERATLETMTMPTKAKQLRLIPMLADFGYKFTYKKLPIVQQTEYVFMLWWADAIKNRIPSSN